MHRDGLPGRWWPILENRQVLEEQPQDWRGSHLEDLYWDGKSTEGTTCSEHPPSRFKKCQRVPPEGWRRETRRFECLESGQKGTSVYSDRHALLRKPRSLEGLALRLEEWYLVLGVRPVWDVLIEATFSGKWHERTLQARFERIVPTHWPELFIGSC